MTTATMTAVEAIQATFAYAAENNLGSDFVGRPKLNYYETTAQGDINITRFKSLDEFPELVEVPYLVNHQLAPGNSKGSRHCLDPDSVKNAKFYKLAKPNAIQGPVFVNDQETLVTHPEHGNQILEPGIYFVTFQTQHAEELRRLAD